MYTYPIDIRTELDASRRWGSEEAFEQEQNRVGVSLGQAGELSPCGEMMGKPPENLQIVGFPHRTLSLEGK